MDDTDRVVAAIFTCAMHMGKQVVAAVFSSAMCDRRADHGDYFKEYDYFMSIMKTREENRSTHGDYFAAYDYFLSIMKSREDQQRPEGRPPVPPRGMR